MCEKCVAAVREIFPELTDEKQVEILWEDTAFPFAGPDEVIRQLRELREGADVGSDA